MSKAKTYPYPVHGWIGIVMIFFTWIGNWTFLGLRTHILFFPLWLGFILCMDGLVFRKKGNSLLTRNHDRFLFLFMLSMPVWWMFEILNIRLENWFYLGMRFFHPVEYFVLASISFSTVIPAILESAEWIGTFTPLRNIPSGFSLPDKKIIPLLFFITGWILFFLLLKWPKLFFPSVWISLFFILDPVNLWSGRLSLIRKVQFGDWRPVLALWLAGMICGLFWEMWNYYSYPKWIYQIPYLNFMKVFEMPIFGYLGYLPFTLEIYAIASLFFGKLDSAASPLLQIILDSNDKND